MNLISVSNLSEFGIEPEGAYGGNVDPRNAKCKFAMTVFRKDKTSFES